MSDEMSSKYFEEQEKIKNKICKYWDGYEKFFIIINETSTGRVLSNSAHEKFYKKMNNIYPDFVEEKEISGNSKDRFDGYSNGIAIELMWGTNEEAEKDILKALLAQTCKLEITELHLYVRCYKESKEGGPYYDQCKVVRTKVEKYEKLLNKNNITVKLFPVITFERKNIDCLKNMKKNIR